MWDTYCSNLFFYFVTISNVMPFERQYNGNKVRECIQKYEHFKSFRKVEKITGVGKSTINRWYIRFSKLAYGFTNSKRICKRKHRSSKFKDLVENIKKLFQSDNLTYLSKQDIINNLPYTVKPSISTVAKQTK
jgi:transposase